MTASRSTPGRLRQALAEPGRAFDVVRALARGHFYKRWLPLRGVSFTAGRNFRVHGRLVVRGPGTVTFGDDVMVNGITTPFTHAPEARIVVGNNVIIGSARFGCVREIVVGDDCLLASAVLTDTDFHSTRADRRHNDDAPIRTAPVRVERNAWIGETAALLAGTTIGENSVVGFGAVCMRAYPPNVVILGNPAKVVGPVPALADAAPPIVAAPVADTIGRAIATPAEATAS